MVISRDVVRRATTEPSRPAVVGPRHLTMAELLDLARQRAEDMHRFAVCGRIDQVDPYDPVETLIDVIAADLAGGAAVLPDPTWPAPVRERALTSAREAVEGGTGGGSGGSRLVVFTSGSTGVPRPIVRTATSWTYSFPTFSAVAGIDADDTVLIPGRLSFSLFLFGAVHALAVGAAVHLLDSWSPTRAASAMSGERGCTAAHAVPAMLDTLLAKPGSLRLALVGGAHLDPGLRERAEDAGVRLVDYYGSSELSFVAIRRDNGRLAPFPGVRVEERDGVLWAHTPYVASNVDTSPDGFATAGDRGRIQDDGSVTVLGRSDSAITTGGATVQAESVENVLRRDPDVRDALVLGTPHGELGEVVTAVLEIGQPRAAPQGEQNEQGEQTERSGQDDPPLPRLRALAAEHLSESERPRRWYVTEELPRTGSGKIARSDVASALAADRFPGRALA